MGSAGIGALHYQTLFWIGPAGALTGLHMDIDALNLLFQVHGTKRFWIYPISQSELVYPSTKYDLGASLAQVDHFAPDFDKYVTTACWTKVHSHGHVNSGALSTGFHGLRRRHRWKLWCIQATWPSFHRSGTTLLGPTPSQCRCLYACFRCAKH